METLYTVAGSNIKLVQSVSILMLTVFTKDNLCTSWPHQFNRKVCIFTSEDSKNTALFLIYIKLEKPK